MTDPTPRDEPNEVVDDQVAVDDDTPTAESIDLGSANPATPAETEPSAISVEDLVADLETVTAERDRYLDAVQRLQAEFENYRKAVAKRELDARERANQGLVNELLPILDACDGAVVNGAGDVAPIRTSLLEALVKQGLERIEDEGAPFDPEQHEAVMHEPSDDGSGPSISQLLRVGYRWKGRVVRPAMVQVRG